MRKFIVITVLAVTALAGFGAQAASASSVHQIASCRNHGKFAQCVLNSVARNHPAAVVAHVTAAPNQSVSASWTLECHRGSRVSFNNGQFTSRTPTAHTLHHSLARPDKCRIQIDASLRHGGRIHLWLTDTSWSRA